MAAGGRDLPLRRFFVLLAGCPASAIASRFALRRDAPLGRTFDDASSAWSRSPADRWAAAAA
ncbi:MAG: hypothetical protein H0U29_05020 [Acidimicrobiia bacterium]|nr:hypothetical protein [Acidimicrobiia bacterium]